MGEVLKALESHKLYEGIMVTYSLLTFRALKETAMCVEGTGAPCGAGLGAVSWGPVHLITEHASFLVTECRVI